MNYFSLLSIPQSFDLDLKQLEDAYFREQRLYHPDRFGGKSEQERLAAAQRSADINKAYQTLKEPLTRAQYLLKLYGVTVGTDHDSVRPSQALLIETLEWREDIEAVAAHPEKLKKIEKLLQEKREASLHVIAREYTNQLWDAMAQETLRLGYIEKALENI
jgi:molecular chaperone HscB